jgi:prepilin-type processing-associated H-X9-DG protein
MGGSYYLKVKWKDSTYGYSTPSSALTLTMLDIKSGGVTALSAYEGQSKAFSLDNTSITYTATGATILGTTVTYAAAVGATSGSFTVSAKGFTQTFTVTVQDVSVVTPTITVTGLNDSNQIMAYADVAISSSAFAISPSTVTGVSDTLVSATWTLLDGTITVWTGTGLTATIPATTFVFDKPYTLRLKHTGSKYGDSANAEKAVTFKAFNVTGANSVDTGNMATYTVSGHNSSSVYTLSVTSGGGSVSSTVSAGTFTYTASSTPGTYILTVTAGGISVTKSVIIRSLFNDIGVAGTQGFGVGAYPGTLPIGFTNLPGNTDRPNNNYGNYLYTDGSVMVYIPKFYYRWGVSGITPTELYTLYGDNSIEIKPADYFANEAEALASGWGLHRAFIDGGTEKEGFWIDKYLVSKNGLVASSIKNGVPLNASSSYAPYSSVTGNGQSPSNTINGMFAVAKTRGNSFFPASVFQIKALAMLSLAHAQACKVNNNMTFCAWGDLGLINSTSPGNFPKCCNYGHNRDYFDQTVTFTTSSSTLPLAGSGTPFEKTTHNGQTCGVSDFGGYQPSPGLTSDGTDIYILKRSVFMKDLTGSTTAANGAFGSAGRNANYDRVTDSIPTTPPYYIGSGSSRAFSNVYASSSSTTAIQITHALSCAGVSLVTTNGGVAMFGLDAIVTIRSADAVPILFLWTNEGAAGGIWSMNLYHFVAGGVSSIISAGRCGFYP